MQPLMSLQKKDNLSWQLPDTAKVQQSRQPPHFYKESTSAPEILSTTGNYLGSHSKHRPSRRTESTTSLPYHASLAVATPARKPVARHFREKRFSSNSIATGPERLENLAKTLLARGSRKLKRHNSQADSSSLRTLEWLDGSEVNMRKHKSQLSLLPEGRHERMHSTGELSLRRHISQPYNFQHLTHTHANQFQTLQKNSHSELVSEFSAIRASQIPCRDLQGIKAESLQSRHLSREAMSGSSSPVLSNHTSTPPVTPRRVEHQRFHSSQASLNLSYPRSPDHFSQPSPRSYKTRPSPITPPPRLSSKHSGSISSPGRLDFPSLDGQVSRGWSSAGITSSSNRIPSPRVLADWEDDLFDYSTIPHAVSTPDETAFILKPAPLGNVEKELPGLPEEPVTPSWEKMSVPSSPAAAPRTSLRHAKSFPSTKSSSRRWSRTSPRVSPDGLVSPLSDGPPLAEAVIPSDDQPLDDIPFRPRLSCRVSSGLSKFEHCWEDDIDYCYEHAAEADCDFDWDRVSRKDEKTDIPMNGIDLSFEKSPSSFELLQEQSDNAAIDPSSSEAHRDKFSTYSSPFYLPHLRLSIQSNLSSRDSSKSSTLSINSPVTPSQSIIAPLSINLPFKTAKDSNLNSPGFIPRAFEPQLTHEEVYQRLLAGDHASEQVYPFHGDHFDTRSTKEYSPRSSHSQMSEKASHESFKIARSNSICPRENESVGSLPDLVFSRNAQTSASAVPNPRIPVDKPLPLRPRLGESRAQLIARQLSVQRSMMWNTSPNDHEDPPLVTSSAQVPSVPSGYQRGIKSSDVVLRINGNLPQLPVYVTSPRRTRASNATYTQPAELLSKDQATPPVLIPVPF